MAMKLAAGLADDWFTPPDQLELEDETEKPTRFKISGLTQIELLEVMAEGETTDDGVFIPNHKGRLLLLRRGLKDWEEVYHPETGQAINFSQSEANNLPAHALAEVAMEILQRSVITEEEKKV